MRRTFLIGNGTSRNPIDLESLRYKGTIVGCNALYRDFCPDVLIAIDNAMIREIADSGYAENNYFVLTNRGKVNANSTNLYRIQYKKPCNTSGGYALKYASTIESNVVYLLGYDCYGSNIYIGTKNYASNIKQDRYKRFYSAYSDIVKHSAHIKYINVIADNRNGLSTCGKYDNFDTMHIEDFISCIPYFDQQLPILAHQHYNIDHKGSMHKRDHEHYRSICHLPLPKFST